MDAAERILNRATRVSGETHLFAEAINPRLGTFLGNFPLLFSQLEYARVLLEIDKARRDGNETN
jgi:GH15 family glucan-1,4-alpha-glucosidase